MDDLKVTLSRIAEILRVPVSAFYDGTAERFRDGVNEVIGLWRMIENPADRRKVLAFMRRIVEQQTVSDPAQGTT